MRLVREWQGQRHVVDVAATGMVWQGQAVPVRCASGNHRHPLVVTAILRSK
ncbi:MAG: hypothetical protein ABI661_01730 [Gammaproteobacteria bacterium]